MTLLLKAVETVREFCALPEVPRAADKLPGHEVGG